MTNDSIKSNYYLQDKNEELVNNIVKKSTGKKDKQKSKRNKKEKKPAKKKAIIGMFFAIIVVIALFLSYNYNIIDLNILNQDTDDEIDNDNLPNTNDIMGLSAYEYSIDKQITQDNNSLKIMFKSYDDGDSITIVDTIGNIEYSSEKDVTYIIFIYNSEINESIILDSLFIFKGDLTNKLAVGDDVKISVTVKHVTFEYEDVNYDLEIFNEEWDENYFNNNGNIKPLPSSAIQKI